MLDFAGVEGITVSFGDEALAKLVVARASGDFTDRGMIIDPDHMSEAGRTRALSILEARRYSGVLSSHSWSTPLDEQRAIQSALVRRYERIRSQKENCDRFGKVFMCP